MFGATHWQISNAQVVVIPLNDKINTCSRIDINHHQSHCSLYYHLYDLRNNDLQGESFECWYDPPTSKWQKHCLILDNFLPMTLSSYWTTSTCSELVSLQYLELKYLYTAVYPLPTTLVNLGILAPELPLKLSLIGLIRPEWFWTITSFTPL